MIAQGKASPRATPWVPTPRVLFSLSSRGGRRGPGRGGLPCGRFMGALQERRPPPPSFLWRRGSKPRLLSTKNIVLRLEPSNRKINHLIFQPFPRHFLDLHWLPAPLT